MSQQANFMTGLGFDDGTPVAQFVVQQGGGSYLISGALDGGRDFFMVKQSGLAGFFDPDIQAGSFDSNLDADDDNNGIGGDDPIPTSWKYPTASTAVSFPRSYYATIDGSLQFGHVPTCDVDIEKQVRELTIPVPEWADADQCTDADVPEIFVPGGAEYQLIVTNEGDSVLTNCTITDAQLDINYDLMVDLAPGEVKILDQNDINALIDENRCDAAGQLLNEATIVCDCADVAGESVDDSDTACVTCIEEDECRVTAGGNKDGLTVPCELKPNGQPDYKTCANKGPDTWGGQAGAPPRTDCNWTHHHKPGNRDNFVFHSNDCFDITCSDPGDICEPASAPSPDRQIDFSGIGSFNNKHGMFASLPDGDLCFRVHLEDTGEPGRGGMRNDIDTTACSHCPGTPIGNVPDCENCTDYYMIMIYDSPDYDDAGDNCLGDLIYVNGAPSYDICDADAGDPLLPGYYVRAGNVQMHTDNNGGSVGNEEICYDGIDNDGDGAIDAADSDCTSTENSCDDGLDNDDDGLTDLDDPDCLTCTPTASNENGPRGSDGIDNDCDGLIDN
jgi:hypothetical protein